MVLENFQLLPGRLIDIAYGLAIAVAIASIRPRGRNLAAGARHARAAAGRDRRRHRPDARHARWCGRARAMGLLVLLLVIHKVLGAPPVLIIATNMLFAAAICGLLAHLLWFSHRRRANLEDETLPRALWIRTIGWLAPGGNVGRAGGRLFGICDLHRRADAVDARGAGHALPAAHPDPRAIHRAARRQHRARPRDGGQFRHQSAAAWTDREPRLRRHLSVPDPGRADPDRRARGRSPPAISSTPRAISRSASASAKSRSPSARSWRPPSGCWSRCSSRGRCRSGSNATCCRAPNSSRACSSRSPPSSATWA